MSIITTGNAGIGWSHGALQKSLSRAKRASPIPHELKFHVVAEHVEVKGLNYNFRDNILYVNKSTKSDLMSKTSYLRSSRET
eukprot:2499639-Amphidinium_carterae.1